MSDEAPRLHGAFFSYVSVDQCADGTAAVVIQLKPAPHEPALAELVGTQVEASRDGITLTLTAPEGLSLGNRLQLASIVGAQGGEGKSLWDGERLFFAHRLHKEIEATE